jgi:Cation transporting ATPase, C-terminus
VHRYALTVATTMGMTTLGLMHSVAALEAREPTETIFKRYTIENRRFRQLIGAALVLSFLVTALSPLQRIFDTVALTAAQWGICLIGPIVYLRSPSSGNGSSGTRVRAARPPLRPKRRRGRPLSQNPPFGRTVSPDRLGMSAEVEDAVSRAQQAAGPVPGIPYRSCSASNPTANATRSRRSTSSPGSTSSTYLSLSLPSTRR